ncbi:MAG: alpha-1,4-glucan--maltose-1-phosphate maltosyltransferase [Vicinamibacterales bacterium]
MTDRPRTGPAPSRVAIENVRPRIECGRFPIKRTVGEPVVVTAEVHADGHDLLRADLRYRRAGAPEWSSVPMTPRGNDVWEGVFEVSMLAPCEYTVVAWPDRFRTWQRDLGRRADADQVTDVDLAIGAALVEAAAGRATGADQVLLATEADALRTGPLAARVSRARLPGLTAIMDRYPDDRGAARHEPPLGVDVDRERARFSAWYELFPRSAGPDGRHGTLADVAARLDGIAAMGFDIVYLPPIHPIGRVKRKGRNNQPEAGPEDVGSPWAIGAREGGHDAIHPDLGTLDDFRALVARARALDLEIALDLALQCAPDHPWVREHPAWFRSRPDGTIQYAENPPKKYEDIYPLDFETDDWRALWDAILAVVEFWVDQGVRVFRVDNPHTKPYAFWEWLIARVRQRTPEVFFLAEAFTRPKVMRRLARLGFSQSYTYFTWRNTRHELTEYLTELTTTDLADSFRPNFWPNTPDILPEPLQVGGRAAFALRVLLASTLGASYGIYGPAFEQLEARALRPGGEEYLDSEKYEIRDWPDDHPESLRELITRVNRIRRAHPALQSTGGLRFIPVDNEQLIAFAKHDADGRDTLIVVVNLDPHHAQSGWLDLPLDALGLADRESFQVHDLLGDARYFWSGARNYVALDPGAQPGHILAVRRRVRTERDFDYYL